ncbi:PAS domain S-box protein [Neopusillimonas aromaticivorans]|uniref:PAS domain S-box protein n=1 Tax=Neopusillimonas aromaticivorans TaxID=2979868 RepID=UPI002599D66D|nr:PAS domain S-box protein [Neopusillimonas aromaticivorans]WJJ93945.1 PAS domain S-box protein [Neopusillimonas aromaticivorans]
MSSLAHTLKELESLSLLGEAFPYEKLLSSTIVGISYMVGWRFVWSNERMHSIFGYLPGDFRGKTARFLYPCQDDYDEVLRRYDLQAENDDFTIERPLVRKDGSLIWCLMSAQRLHVASSDEASVWVVQDVTEQRNAVDALKRTNQRLEQIIERRTMNLRRTNQALRLEVERRQALQFDLVASREKYRALFRHLPVGVLVTNRQGEIVEINQATQSLAAARSRIELMHLLNDTSRVLQPDGTTMSLAQFVQQHRPSERRKIDRSTLVWQSNSGGLRELSMIATALASHELGAIFTFEDVTEIKRAREREHEQQQHLAHAARLSLMGQIASAMAHELGQPLNACQSYISGVRHRLGTELHDKPELLEAIDKIALHLDSASKIIGNVRGLYRAGRLTRRCLI